MVTAQAPQYYQNYQPHLYRNEDPQYFRRQDRRQDRRPVRCFLCDEEGHLAYRCPARTLLQRLLRQQAPEPGQTAAFWPSIRAPSQLMVALTPPLPIAFKLTEGSPKAKVAPVG